jgi:DNA-nicking Smr family endonuclease
LRPVRPLSTEEQLLWSRVAATIRPLSREKVQALVAEKTEEPVLTNAPSKGVGPSPPKRVAAAPRHVAATLDGTWDRRLRSGTIAPDRVLDLHGMNLDRAWHAIDLTLDKAIRAGDRVVLLVTGHHRPGDQPVQRGRIRAAVHDWLAASRHASAIAAVRGAHRRHGGGGSLYIILRRR